MTLPGLGGIYMLVSDLVTRVRSELLEPSAGFWSDDEIKIWLGEALHQLPEPEVIFTLLTTAGQGFVSLRDPVAIVTIPTDVTQVSVVTSLHHTESDNIYQPTDALTRSHPQDEDFAYLSQGANRYPMYYYVWNNRIYFAPIPDAVYTIRGTGKARIWPDPAVLPDATNVDWITESFHPLAITLMTAYATSMAKRKDSDPNWMHYFEQYNILYGQVRRGMARSEDTPLVVKVVE